MNPNFDPNIGKATQFKSGEEAAKAGQKGGYASGESRRKDRLLKDSLEVALTMRMMKNGKQAEHPVTGEPLDAFDAGMVALVTKYTKGDLKAIEDVAKLLGQWKDQTDVEHHGEVGLTISHMTSGIIPAESEDEVLKREGINGTV